MSCEDIPSLLDLQNTKKHVDDLGRLMGTGTGTSTNGVTGQVRPTYNAVMANLGYTRVGTFATGGTLTAGRQTLLWDVADGGDGQEYGWSGSFPLAGKVVPPGSTPLTTGGIAVGAWMSRFDPELRVQIRESLRRSYADAGYSLVAGSFEAGGTVNTVTDVLLYEAEVKAYRWDGALSKVVPANSTPISSGGIGVAAWIDQSSLYYRYKAPLTTKRTKSDKLDEYVSLIDFHCDSNGTYIPPGPTVDSRQYIQNAIDHIASIGGGTLIIPNIAVAWHLGSFGVGGVAGHSGIIQLKSNVHLRIEGKIQLGSFFSDKAFQVFVGFDNADPSASSNLSNCHIYGSGTIDFGSSNMPSGGVLRNVVTFGKSYNCSLRDMTLQNGDMTWGATIGWNGYGSNTVIENVRFDNLILSANNPDHSTVYVNAPYSGVDRCLFYSTNTRASIIACTVELHQHDTWYTGSNMLGYTRGCYVVMHADESVGAGSYLYSALVSGNVGSISGQFVIFSSDLVGATQAHVSNVVVANNVITHAEGFQFGAFVDIAPTNAGNIANVDVSKLLIIGNTFTSPSTASGSAAITVNANLNGITFSGNYFDTRTLLRMAGAPVGVATCANFVWDESNILGPGHNNLRSGLNLMDFRFASVVSSNIRLKLASEDASLYSGILFSTGCAVSFTTVRMSADFTGNMIHPVVFEGNQQTGANVYVEFPEDVAITSFNTTGAVAFFSVEAKYIWVTHAHPLALFGDAKFYGPPAYTAQVSGQLWGLGYNVTGAVRNGTVRMMLKRKV